jgi:hypothetical protein
MLVFQRLPTFAGRPLFEPARRARTRKRRPALPARHESQLGDSPTAPRGSDRVVVEWEVRRSRVQLLAVPGWNRRIGFGALFCWPRLPAQAKRAVDQTDVAVGLRKIAQHPATSRIELLGEQADVITV